MESVQFEVRWLEVSVKGRKENYPPLRWWLSQWMPIVIITEPKLTLNRHIIEVVLAEVHRLFVRLSSLRTPPLELFGFDVNWPFHVYLRPFFDAVQDRTLALRSSSTNKVEAHVETFFKSTRSIVSYCSLWLTELVFVALHYTLFPFFFFFLCGLVTVLDVTIGMHPVAFVVVWSRACGVVVLETVSISTIVTVVTMAIFKLDLVFVIVIVFVFVAHVPVCIPIVVVDVFMVFGVGLTVLFVKLVVFLSMSVLVLSFKFVACDCSLCLSL